MTGEYVALSGVFVTLILAILQFLWNSNVKAAEIRFSWIEKFQALAVEVTVCCNRLSNTIRVEKNFIIAIPNTEEEWKREAYARYFEENLSYSDALMERFLSSSEEVVFMLSGRTDKLAQQVVSAMQKLRDSVLSANPAETAERQQLFRGAVSSILESENRLARKLIVWREP
tara:strand:- start:338 stop:853 length:516 start_codon:yes stop_codon:yes gene_type:complete